MRKVQNPPAQRLRFPLWAGPVVAALAIHAAAILAYVGIYRGDVSSLVCADQNIIGQSPFEAVRVGFGSRGFDGQYYYVLARDPWRLHGEALDSPALRHSRILYPALAWLLSGGDPEWLLWVLPAINLAAITVLSWLGALLAAHYGRSPWWGLVLPVVVNAGTPAFRDLTDPVSVTATCGLVTAWLLGWRAWIMAAWAMAAVLGREQNLVIVLIVLLETLVRRSWSKSSALGLVVFTWIGWVLFLRSVYGVWPFLPENNSVPLAGVSYRLTHMTGGRGTLSSPVHAVGMALLILQLVLSWFPLFFRADRMVILICLAGTSLAVVAGVPIFLNLESYTRVFWWMPFGVWLWSVQSGRRWPMLLLSAAMVLPVVALVQAWNTVQAGNVIFIH